MWIKWVGGKGRLIPQFRELFGKDMQNEKYRVYQEPFLGSGAVFLQMASDRTWDKVILSDTNAELINTWQMIQSNLNRVLMYLNQMVSRYESLDEEGKKDCYLNIRSFDNSGNKEYNAARFIFLNKTGFNGLYRVNKSGKFNVPWGKKLTISGIIDLESLEKTRDLIANKNVEFRVSSYVQTETDKDTFTYCDPPYIPISKTSNFVSYSESGFDETDQKNLEKVGVESRGFFAVSNSYCEQSLKLYQNQNWDVKEVVTSRSISCDKESRGNIREIIAIRKGELKT